MRFRSCKVHAEEDGLLLAFSAAVEKVLDPMPPPPSTPACRGCTPRVLLQEANYTGIGKPKADDVTSLFKLRFDGHCLLNGHDAAVPTPSSRTEL